MIFLVTKHGRVITKHTFRHIIHSEVLLLFLQGKWLEIQLLYYVVFSHYIAAFSNVGTVFLFLRPVQTERVRVINIFLSLTSGSTNRGSLIKTLLIHAALEMSSLHTKCTFLTEFLPSKYSNFIHA
jgi:hypothetical protein